MQCPFCHYERQPTDDNPAWECPKCLKAYNKHPSTPHHSSQNNRLIIDDDEPTIGERIGMVLALLIFCWISIRNLYTTISFGYIEACSRNYCWLVYFYDSPLEFIFQFGFTTLIFGYLCMCVYRHITSD